MILKKTLNVKLCKRGIIVEFLKNLKDVVIFGAVLVYFVVFEGQSRANDQKDDDNDPHNCHSHDIIRSTRLCRRDGFFCRILASINWQAFLPAFLFRRKSIGIAFATFISEFQTLPRVLIKVISVFSLASVARRSCNKRKCILKGN